MHHTSEKRLPFVVEAFADSGSSFALLCSPATWAHVNQHLHDTIMDCNERVAFATGMLCLTKRATVLVELTLSDGLKVNAPMPAYQSDKDLLGLIGLEILDWSVCHGSASVVPRCWLVRIIISFSRRFLIFQEVKFGVRGVQNFAKPERMPPIPPFGTVSNFI